MMSENLYECGICENTILLPMRDYIIEAITPKIAKYMPTLEISAKQFAVCCNPKDDDERSYILRTYRCPKCNLQWVRVLNDDGAVSVDNIPKWLIDHLRDASYNILEPLAG